MIKSVQFLKRYTRCVIGGKFVQTEGRALQASRRLRGRNQGLNAQVASYKCLLTFFISLDFNESLKRSAP